MTGTSVTSVLAERHITRLCHFTPSRNLPHILHDGLLRPTKDLANDVRAVYTATDLVRLDGQPDKLCCTIEYPNAYYWSKARVRGEGPIFPTWVVLLLDPALMRRPTTLFCTGNASRSYGANARPGADGLRASYQPEVIGSGGRTFTRSRNHLASCPTDLQAEVLIPGPIPLTAVQAIAVRTVEQAATEAAILARLSLPIGKVRWVVAPVMFQPNALASAIHGGRPPTETAWVGSVETARE